MFRGFHRPCIHVIHQLSSTADSAQMKVYMAILALSLTFKIFKLAFSELGYFGYKDNIEWPIIRGSQNPDSGI